MTDKINRLDVSPVTSEIQRLTTALEDTTDPNPQLTQTGMALFQLGSVASSIDDFDRAERLKPALNPYLWQRGIAYYYAERFEEGPNSLRRT